MRYHEFRYCQKDNVEEASAEPYYNSEQMKLFDLDDKSDITIIYITTRLR